MHKADILLWKERLHAENFFGRTIGRLVVTENDLCRPCQVGNSASSVLNVSSLVLAWNDNRHRERFPRNREWQHARDHHLGHAEFVQKWQPRTKAVQKP